MSMENLRPDTLFSRDALWQSWLDVEAALAQTQAELGIIPADAAQAISEAAHLDKLDRDALARDISYTMAPILSLTRFLSKAAGPAGDYVHWGATTQNVMQTGRILLIRRADTEIRGALSGAFETLATLATDHAETFMPGRTNRQHALPITFGFKVASWIEELSRAVERLDAGANRLFALPFGGAVGAMHAFGGSGREVNQRLAARLGLRDLLVPGRTINDLFADYILQLSLLAMTIERIASEIYLLMTQEINELAEVLDKGTVGSSTMPHKVNPKFVVRVLAEAAELRGLAGSALETGRSSHEGDAATNQLLSRVLDRAVPLGWTLAEGFAHLLGRIRVLPENMAANAELSGGAMSTENLMMVLSPHTGRAAAHDLIHHALDHTDGMPIVESLSQNPTIRAHLDEGAIRSALDPAQYCGDSASIALQASELANRLSTQLR
ncbi:3-carboxy-cis,cis-muconate cycloisomerase [Monaibacterium marinum]|uniref:3-carboxy-cis,cis-muconate cycloisomerase n=1 Tax=Pontivivens marinum TaxID=1690039 RepID=A0A2C9CSP0_9RHOB|nr:lyase family protein [Monaibacterium marinum]SOH94376.1 3-carboxy-cis,cis-muconate cycloisomerase [Monaibacterium marinum]